MEESTIATLSNKNYNNQTNYDNLNINKLNEYVEMNIDTISNIISTKINNAKIINDQIIDKILMGLKLHCQNHNNMINRWFDEAYDNNLKLFKKNNNKHKNFLNEFNLNSFVSIVNLI